mmetsp:Transcript_91238/g.294947  ORF Transcript_91238/g.294947 Transcript_91238/m.294947 type:complete len:625 (+) Transcript_91238:1943-3817(+)
MPPPPPLPKPAEAAVSEEVAMLASEVAGMADDDDDYVRPVDLKAGLPPQDPDPEEQEDEDEYGGDEFPASPSAAGEASPQASPSGAKRAGAEEDQGDDEFEAHNSHDEEGDRSESPKEAAAAANGGEKSEAKGDDEYDDDDDDGNDSDGSSDGGKAKSPSGSDYFMHAIAIPWKLPFAVLVPPASLASGWPCFAMSLVFIGLLTCWVIDFAELFGCCANVRNEITAITLVALGTSMPDLFASKQAACKDEYADASIVNVTGSNSVNVFLGIGVPWVMSSVYWKVVGATDEWKLRYKEFVPDYPNGAFIVKSGDLAFGVIVFSLGAFVALTVLRVRRNKLGGELGGPYIPKAMTALLFTLLWFFYMGLSIWKITAGAASLGSQLFAIFMGICVLENVMLVLGVAAYIMGGRSSSKQQREPKGDIDIESYNRHVTLGRPTPPLEPPPAVPEQLAQASSPAGLRGAGRAAHHGRAGSSPYAGANGATVYGSPIRPRASGSAPMSFTNAAMVCLAVKRFKALDRRFSTVREAPLLAAPPPWESHHHLMHGRPGLQRDNSFHSLEESSVSYSPRPDPHQQPQRSVAGRVVDYVGRNAVDWAALSAAGLAAAQVVDLQSGGGLMGGAPSM